MPSISRKKFNIGVTGTGEGCTSAQLILFEKALERYILDYYTYHQVVFHHGACVGADVETAVIANSLKIHVTVHPPIELDSIGEYLDTANEVTEPMAYLERDRKIVDVSDLMFVFPKDFDLDNDSGTVTTYKYALEQNKPYIIIYPDGTITDTSCLWK